MQNIALPGVFPGVIALLLTLTAVRGYSSYKKNNDKRYRTSMILCTTGAVLFALIAVFQLIKS
jgi:nitric oxide reductase large subunit